MSLYLTLKIAELLDYVPGSMFQFQKDLLAHIFIFGGRSEVVLP